MTFRRITTAVAAAALLALGACAADEPDPLPGATVQEWQVEILPLQRTWDDLTEKWNSGCSPETVSTDADCLNKLVDLVDAARSIRSSVTVLQDEGGVKYLPGRPDEIVIPLAETTKAVENPATAAEHVRLDCPGEGCGPTVESFLRHWGTLGDALALWPTP